MIQYYISSPEPVSRWVEIIVKLSGITSDSFEFQLPAWRPGRYELANFAKNVSRVKAIGKGSLNVSKITKDRWKVQNDGSDNIEFSYRYYASDWNAGSTYTCEDFLYVNPVNCLAYEAGMIHEACEVFVDVPSEFDLAIGVDHKKIKNQFVFSCNNFHELADSPFIASRVLQSSSYQSNGIKFTVWFNGVCKPDWKKITADFKKFTDRQIKSFGKFTCKEYHFLIHALPFNFYHGVEHLTTSVNALGPGYSIMEERYIDLLGLCSHELYHSWNIKSIRPAEMFPYNYEKENYFETGYVAEGVTTYMGDMMLYASGVFDTGQFMKELTIQVQKHIDNAGKENYSVAQSGYDAWLDGYVPGVPERKVSIYTEGCLIALICDIIILKNSKGQKNLDHVMLDLYENFALKNKGYTTAEYRLLVEKYAGCNLSAVFNGLVNGTEAYLPHLEKWLKEVSVEINKMPSSVIAERAYGMKLTETPDKSVVAAIWPGSPSSKSLALNDQVISVNGMAVHGDVNRWLEFFQGEKIVLTVIRGATEVKAELKADGNNYYYLYVVSPMDGYPNELAKRWKER